MEYIEVVCDKCRHLLGAPVNLTNHNCGGKLIPLELEHDDYITLCKVWSTGNEIDYTVHWDLYNSMVELKKNDIIEYNLKMTQFRNQVEQQKSIQTQNNNRPKCPSCGSNNISNIGVVGRAISFSLVGFASSKIGKTHKCNNCGTTW